MKNIQKNIQNKYTGKITYRNRNHDSKRSKQPHDHRRRHHQHNYTTAENKLMEKAELKIKTCRSNKNDVATRLEFGESAATSAAAHA